MNIYDWESNPRAHRKKVKKTGTVVLHPNLDNETHFDRFLKQQPVYRANPFERTDADLSSEEDENANEFDDKEKKRRLPTFPLMTEETMDRLRSKLHFTALLPSQAQCYKGIFLRRDVILHSRTGSGKTLAYALPIVERYLIFKAFMDRKRGSAAVDDTPVQKTGHQKNAKKQQQNTSDAEAPQKEEGDGPFLLVFVFSMDLAVQTHGVLSSLYPQLRIEVPGYTATSRAAPANNPNKGAKESTTPPHKAPHVFSDEESRALRAAHILIGTVHNMDVVLRGRQAAVQALQEEQKEAAEALRWRSGGPPGSRKRRGSESTPLHETKKSRTEASTDKEEEEEGLNESDDDDDTSALVGAGIVSAANVQAIVIDEVDTTLGPRFSSVGRRMKNLLKYIRKSDGALTPGLLQDYRAHHYVLCGATIPNWVIKAGFLGVKKYYYRLVNPGASKLAEGLECFRLPCPLTERVQKAAELLMNSASKNSSGEAAVDLGRVVVFGTHKQIEQLSQALVQRGNTTPSSAKGEVFTLTARMPEQQRIEAFTSFNTSPHPAAMLLCTDIAARGLDLVGADTILMLSLPMGPMAVETFIHRAGRTARVDKSGRCVVLLEPASTTGSASTPSTSLRFSIRDEEKSSFARITTGAHVDFRDFSATLGGQEKSRVVLQLEVKRPFHAPQRPDAMPLPSAREVLEKELDAPKGGSPNADGNKPTTPPSPLWALVRDVQEEEPRPRELVRFTVPLAELHQIQKRLWKYKLKELERR